jgi:transposase
MTLAFSTEYPVSPKADSSFNIGMIPKAAEVRMTPEDRAVLEARVRAPTTEQRDVFRARIVLLSDEGRSTRSIVRAVETMPRTVSLWRGRFSREGLAGLTDKPRPGSVAKYNAETGKRILAVLDRPPPAGFARWTGGLIAAELGDVRSQKIDLAGRKSWCEMSGVRRQGRRRGGALHGASGERDRHLCRRKALDPGAGARPGVSEAAQWQGPDRS